MESIPRTRDGGIETGSYAKFDIRFSCSRDFCSDIARLRICSCASGLRSSFLETRLDSSSGSISSSSEANRTAPPEDCVSSLLSAFCGCSCFALPSAPKLAYSICCVFFACLYLYRPLSHHRGGTWRIIWKSYWRNGGVEGF